MRIWISGYGGMMGRTRCDGPHDMVSYDKSTVDPAYLLGRALDRPVIITAR
jgi:hypothetical protein